MPTTSAAIVVDDSGVRIGTVDGNGQVHDFARVRIGSARADGVAVDFAGRRLGRVVS
ncbi:hypothetical protein [Pseudonocardia sp. NPDC049154]|uniref:hypothetical protein n=1 Tax=Pseudonocardia sp. NPDC049154 TaxID=3155501 RepID=UPI0033FBE98C